MFNQNTITNPYSTIINSHQNNLFKYKYNIFWIGFIMFNIVTNTYIANTLNNLEESNYCGNKFEYDNDFGYNDEFEFDNKFDNKFGFNDEFGCDELLSHLLDKNNFSQSIILYFLITQIIIFVFEIFINLTKYIWCKINLANVIGIIYMSSSIWYDCLFFAYKTDFYYYDSYRIYIDSNSILDPIKLSTWYYMFGEILIVGLVVLPILFIFMLLFLIFLTNIINYYHRKK